MGSLEMLCLGLLAKHHLKEKSQYLLTVANSCLLNPKSIQDVLFKAMGGSQFYEKHPKQIY